MRALRSENVRGAVQGKGLMMVQVTDECVEFAFYRPQAECVSLAGEFNEWRTGELPMEKTSGGYWMTRIHLPAGEFKFRYCADGEWFTDYAAFGVEPGRFGMDSIVRITPKPIKVITHREKSTSKVAAA